MPLVSDDAYKTVLQAMRTKIFLNAADEVAAEYASRMCGREDQVQQSHLTNRTKETEPCR